MSEHKRRASSAAARWMNCAGAPNLTEKLIEEGKIPERSTNEYAAWGTVAHEIAAQCLTEDDRAAWEFMGGTREADGFSFLIDAEMAETVQSYVDTVREDLHQYGGTLLVEHKSSLTGGIWDETGGTLDAGIDSNDGWFRLHDLKTGYKIVEPEANPQQMIYAAQFMAEHPKWAKHWKGVELIIDQPRAPHPQGPVRRWRISLEDLVTWYHMTLMPKVKATLNPDAPRQVGEWCTNTYCPAQEYCPEFQARVATVRGDATGNRDIDAMEPWELGEAKALQPLVQSYFDKVDERIFSLQMAGTSVPGRKLVHKITKRVWKPGAEENARYEFGPEAFTEPKLLSPAQMEKLGPTGKTFTDTEAFKPPGGLTSASSDDKRTEVLLSDPQSTFGDMLNTQGNSHG